VHAEFMLHGPTRSTWSLKPQTEWTGAGTAEGGLSRPGAWALCH